ncbi:MAG TPA: hypothetical protein PKA06_04790 [Gemmatales bacterium]|nr:hypothetical protein [Gemmatales bacterium]HMP16915.1 hypothetical protein [Gemmatales bacterium]
MALFLFTWLVADVPALNEAALPAWIASLHQHEREYGRTGWSWKALTEARSAVMDGRYAYHTSKRWWFQLYTGFVNNQGILLILVSVAGFLFCVYFLSQGYWWTLLFSSLLWLLLVISGISLLHPGSEKYVVIKQHGLNLRIGNGISYPLLLDSGQPVWLSRGVEARWRAEMPNSWIQIELADGLMGWAPREALYLIP